MKNDLDKDERVKAGHLSTGEHPIWVWIAFGLTVFWFVLHGHYNKPPLIQVPMSQGNLTESFCIGDSDLQGRKCA
jgi:hypothetical protein